MKYGFFIKPASQDALVNNRQYLCLYGDDWMLMWYDSRKKELFSVANPMYGFLPETIQVFELPDSSD